jgi:gliding motility-associated-like protein
MSYMQSILFFAITVCFSFGFCAANAQAPCVNPLNTVNVFHINSTAFDFGYESVNDSVYKLRLKILTKCVGPDMDSIDILGGGGQVVVAWDTCNRPIYTFLTNTTVEAIAVLPDGRPDFSKVIGNYCSSFACRCDTPYDPTALIGYRERWLEGFITLPENCGLWTIRDNSTLRDTTTTNISHCVNYEFLPTTYAPNMHIQALINHLPGINNNSATALNAAPIYVCENQPYVYNPGFVDQDGDSLVHTLINTQYSRFKHNVGGLGYISQPLFSYLGMPAFADIPFSAPFSLTEPFSTNNTFTFNSADGSMSFTPTPNQNPILSTRTDEYRNGVWVGSSMRDFTFVTLPCTNQPCSSQIQYSSLVNATAPASTELLACINQSMQACFWLSNADATSAIKASSNITQALPGSTVSFTQISNDSIKACITWTPTAADVGNNQFTFAVTDTSCKAPGVAIPYTFGYNIKVQNIPALIANDSICQGASIVLQSTQNSLYNFVWSNASGANNFNCNTGANCPTITAYPTTTETYYVTAATIGGACIYTDTIKLFVVNKFTLNATDSIVCGLKPNIALAANAQGQNMPLTYAWLPTLGIIGGTNLDIINISTANTTYTVTASDIMNCFTITDIATIQYEPNFNAIATASKNSICSGDTVALSASGGTVTWNPLYNISNASGSSALVWPDTSTTYNANISSTNGPCVANIALPIQANALRADAGNDTTIRDGDLVRLGGVNMLCDNGCIHFWYDDINLLSSNLIHDQLYPIARPPRDMTFRLRLVSADGACADEDFVNIKVSCDNADIANSFMPDNYATSDINRSFGVRNAGLTNYNFSIYNRYGERVFFTQDCLVRWNGKYKNKPCPMDTYVYVITGTCANGKTINRNGNVTLIR